MLVLYFKKDMDDLLDSKLGVMNRSSFGKIDFDHIKAECYEKIDVFYGIRSFCDETILMD